MSGRLKNRVDMEDVARRFEKTHSYSKVAEELTEELGEHVQGALVRYWLSSQDIKPREQKILLFDIETAPIEAYVWGLFKQNISLPAIKEDWYVLMWAAKWLHDEDTYFDALNQYDDYNGGREMEIRVVESLWHLLNEADIVVAQNGVNFDIKKMNAKFLEHGFDKPAHYKVVDTLQIARYNFGFTSNKLDYMSKLMGHEGKNKTDFQLWVDCMNGEEAAWQTMIDYCIMDVDQLEQVYLDLRAWDNRHPPVITGNVVPKCNVCGSEHRSYISDYETASSRFEIYRCDDCGHQQRSKVNVMPKEEKTVREVNV